VIIVSEHERKKIIPIAGGKGGTGKSFIASNVAIRLAAQGRKVILIDGDIGASNAHTYLYIKNQHYGIANYIHNDELSFRELIQETDYQNLHFIAGDVLVPNSADMHVTHIDTILDEIIALPYDYIVLDLGSNSSTLACNSFSIVNAGILVTTPNLPSILSTYNFFKNALFNFIIRYALQENRQNVTEYLDTVLHEKAPNSTPRVNEILLEIEKIDSYISNELRTELYLMKPFLVMNCIRSDADLEYAHNLRKLIYKNTNIEIEFLGAIFEDGMNIRRAEELSIPLINSDVESRAKDGIERIAQKILLSPDFPILPLDLEMYKDTYELVELEVQQELEEVQQELSALEREEYLAQIESLEQKIATMEARASSADHEVPAAAPSARAREIEQPRTKDSSENNEKVHDVADDSAAKVEKKDEA